MHTDQRHSILVFIRFMTLRLYVLYYVDVLICRMSFCNDFIVLLIFTLFLFLYSFMFLCTVILYFSYWYFNVLLCYARIKI